LGKDARVAARADSIRGIELMKRTHSFAGYLRTSSALAALLAAHQAQAQTAPAQPAAAAVDEGLLAAEGSELVEVPSELMIEPRPEMRITLLYDFKKNINAYLAGTPDTMKVRTLADLIAFSKTDPRESMHLVDVWEDSQATEGGRSNPAYIENLAKAYKMTRDDGIDRILKEFNTVAIVTPTGAPAAVLQPDGTPGVGPIPKGPRGTTPPSLTSMTAVAGYPVISVPMGLIDGLPVGLSFGGTAWSDASVLALAYDYEQASNARVPPPRARAAAPQ
jgi:amidase